jgi:hypothetical protein
MNRSNRSPILFTLATVLLLFSLVAYLISRAEYNRTPHESALPQH